MNREELKKSLGDELCEYCPLKNGQILDLQNSLCEGLYCDEAFDNFLEENENYLDDYEDEDDNS